MRFEEPLQWQDHSTQVLCCVYCQSCGWTLQAGVFIEDDVSADSRWTWHQGGRASTRLRLASVASPGPRFDQGRLIFLTCLRGVNVRKMNSRSWNQRLEMVGNFQVGLFLFSYLSIRRHRSYIFLGSTALIWVINDTDKVLFPGFYWREVTSFLSRVLPTEWHHVFWHHWGLWVHDLLSRSLINYKEPVSLHMNLSSLKVENRGLSGFI